MLSSKRRDAIIDSQIRWINKRTYNEMDREGIWHERNTKRRKRTIKKLGGN